MHSLHTREATVVTFLAREVTTIMHSLHTREATVVTFLAKGSSYNYMNNARFSIVVNSLYFEGH